MNKRQHGLYVREVVQWFLRRLELPLSIDEMPDPESEKPEDFKKVDEDWNLIVILSRKSNRLILNEKELGNALTKRFGWETVVVSNEQHSFEEQIKYMRRARIVLGMHGSILVMAMFCRRGTTLLEMFPFAVPAERYTPYKTMANLPDMGLIYRVWVVYFYLNCLK
jgi:hypothetical protein